MLAFIIQYLRMSPNIISNNPKSLQIDLAIGPLTIYAKVCFHICVWIAVALIII